MRSRDVKRSNARGYGYSSSGHLSTCSHCNATIYWHKSKTGGWLPPLESYVAGNCSPGESILHECGVKATPRAAGRPLEITVSTRQATNSPLPVLQTVRIPVTTAGPALLSLKREAISVPKPAKGERDLLAAQQLGISLEELKLRRRQQALQEQALHVSARRLGITVKALRRRGLDGDGGNGTTSDKPLMSVPRPRASKASGQRTVRTPPVRANVTNNQSKLRPDLAFVSATPASIIKSSKSEGQHVGRTEAMKGEAEQHARAKRRRKRLVRAANRARRPARAHQECAGPRGAEWRLERWR
jgi:hypothetical protein